jgi:diguanylate cyclase (GGDEF)-like protein
MDSLFFINLFSIIPLLFTMSLAYRHVLQNNENVYYLIAAILTCLQLIMEITMDIMERYPQGYYRTIVAILIAFGFVFSLLFFYIILLFVGADRLTDTVKKLSAIPVIANVFISFLSIRTGWLFEVFDFGVYIRGPLYIVEPIACLIYSVVIFFLLLVPGQKERTQSDTFLLLFIFMLPWIATVIQTFYSSLLITWSSIALSLLILYIFLLDQQFKYDVQTGLKNRKSFELHMQELARSDKEATIFVFDLNNLKTVNDHLGHLSGDERLSRTAACIRKTFKSIGQSYRIGGDEFCAICDVLSPGKTEQLLSCLDSCIEESNKLFSSGKIVLAHGYAISSETVSPYQAFSLADNAMYRHKAFEKRLDQMIITEREGI